MAGGSQRRDRLSASRRRLLEQRLKGKPRAEARHSVDRDPGEAVPATPLQEQLWAFARSHPDSAAYHLHAAVRLAGRLDVAALESGFREAIRRHEALRTSFAYEDGRLVQRIAPEVPFALRVEPAGDDVLARATAEARRSFDLDRAPLLRAILFEEGPDRRLLVAVLHHIVCDEASLDVLWEEVGGVYGGRALPPVGAQFADLALAAARDGSARKRDADYWVTALADVERELALPRDRSRTARPGHRGRFVREDLDPDLAGALKTVAKGVETTPFVVAFAAYAVLLARWSGQRSFAVGVPATTRSVARSERAIGLLIASLPLACRVDDEVSFRDLLVATREGFLEGLDRAGAPFDEVAARLEPGRNPLFQTMFVHESDPLARLGLPGIEAERVELDTGGAKFDITLFVHPEGDRPSVAIEFDTAIVETETARRFLASYVQVLRQVLGDPSIPVGRVETMEAAERERLLERVCVGPAPPEVTRTVPERITHWPAVAPSSTAVSCKDDRVTYGELGSAARALAGRLQAEGVVPGDFVALQLERGPDALIAILGVHLAGAAYVPLDPAYPGRRRAAVLDDLARSTGKRPVAIAADDADLPAEAHRIAVRGPAADYREVAADAGRPAYAIYTSGSTGRPKGVVVTHANLAASTAARRVTYDRPERFLLVPSFAFDSSVAGIFWTLAEGGTLVVPRDDEARDPAALARVIGDRRVTHTLLLPSLWRFVLEIAADGELDSLRTVIVAGEAVTADLVRVHHARLPGVALYNEYGPTEGTVWASVERLTAGDDREPVPIGRPIPGGRVYVLDAKGLPLPVGAAGELVIGGPGVARGYLGDRQETARRFVPDPFMEEGTVYRTGDRARYRPDGRLEFLGRMDEQLKLRGHRIEPAEIEAAMGAHPDVRNSAVAVATSEGAGETLVVFYESARTIDQAELRGLLRKTLPEFMVPQTFARTEALPRLANGKVDRRTLASLPIEREETTAGPVALNAREAELAEVWQRVLGAPVTRPDDDFFDLGGHSLMGVRLVLEVQRRFDIEIPLAELFRAPTLAAMAASLEGPALGPNTVAPVQSGGERPPLFCVHAGGALFAEVMGPEQPIYLVFDDLSATRADTTSVESIARHYLEDVRRVQPAGPYYLLGYSFGGMLAYEMAHQLTTAGQRVAIVGLIDPPPVWGLRRLQLSRKLFVLGRVRGLAGKLRHLGREVSQLFRRALPGKPAAGPAVEADPDEQVRAANVLFYKKMALTYCYPPARWPCALFLQEGLPAWMRFLERRWREVLDDVRELEFVEGVVTHTDVARAPYDKLIADRLAAIVRETQERERS